MFQVRERLPLAGNFPGVIKGIQPNVLWAAQSFSCSDGRLLYNSRKAALTQ